MHRSDAPYATSSVLAGFANIFCEGHCERPAAAPRPADWIIVGGGASGCSAAAALADAGEEVLVLERGQSDLDRNTGVVTWGVGG